MHSRILPSQTSSKSFAILFMHFEHLNTFICDLTVDGQLDI